ncbi:pyridoxal 5'-phosphate synthase glutaminase subunit PdxT [Aeromicrobium sp. CTD01-1L150]|uniref:pyridoxal 5'-phosphate synthase glutaminase subunit PdxT n=1 Tax=Aeromicrobium sp. CTD01-1L150 TaxID=3341830 RepID=UPI0035C0EED0
MTSPNIGVLALQGDVREHVQAIERLGVRAFGVRRSEEVDRCDGLIVPGGESTTMIKLARVFGVLEPIRRGIADGLPVFGTCAGMIMLADRLRDGADGQETFGGLDATVRRNAFGRQVDSFEADLDFTLFDDPVHAVFIRAPWIEEVGPGVDVLASVPIADGPGSGDHPTDRIVAVQQGPMLATSFHPEVDDDLRLHRHFLDIVSEPLETR